VARAIVVAASWQSFGAGNAGSSGLFVGHTIFFAVEVGGEHQHDAALLSHDHPPGNEADPIACAFDVVTQRLAGSAGNEERGVERSGRLVAVERQRGGPQRLAHEQPAEDRRALGSLVRHEGVVTSVHQCQPVDERVLHRAHSEIVARR
jgi:hypothetical protein